MLLGRKPVLLGRKPVQARGRGQDSRSPHHKHTTSVLQTCAAADPPTNKVLHRELRRPSLVLGMESLGHGGGAGTSPGSACPGGSAFPQADVSLVRGERGGCSLEAGSL